MKKIISIIFTIFFALFSYADDTVMVNSSTGVVTHPANFAESNNLATKSYVDEAVANNTSTNVATDAPELYLVYQTSASSTTTYRVDFDTTAEMKAWIKSNYSSLRYALKAVRKNVDDGFTDYSRFFYGSSTATSSTYGLQITSLDLSEFDTTGAITMDRMFYYCQNLTSLDLSNFDTSNVTTMAYMFYFCSSLTSLDLSNFDTSNVTTMAYMFYFCSSLTSLDLSSFDTSNVTTMERMFLYCFSPKIVYWATNKDTVEPLQSSSYLGSYGCSIVVPTSLLSSYKSSTYFSAWSSKIIGTLCTPTYPSADRTLSLNIDLYRDGLDDVSGNTYNTATVKALYYSDVIVKVINKYGDLLYFFSTIVYDSDMVQSMHNRGIYDSGALVYYQPTGRILDNSIYGTVGKLRPKMQFPSKYWADYCVATFEEAYSGQSVYNGITTASDNKLRITNIQIYPSLEFYDIFLDPTNTVLVNRQTTLSAEVDGKGNHLFRHLNIQKSN